MRGLLIFLSFRIKPATSGNFYSLVIPLLLVIRNRSTIVFRFFYCSGSSLHGVATKGPKAKEWCPETRKVEFASHNLRGARIRTKLFPKEKNRKYKCQS
ncbi:hypothetical protein C4565_02185 [Candidatus Parcubacteria bacterium]|nr:MAG: hypothetical protein C4565_02185 [Candidatus Parcubacteria bacterium]